MTLLRSRIKRHNGPAEDNPTVQMILMHKASYQQAEERREYAAFAGSYDTRLIGLRVRARRQSQARRAVRSRGEAGPVSIAGHPSDELHPKTLATILRQAGLKGEK